ncbi:S8 family serine peptidase [Bacillus sp. JJ1122]|uniref:S8 family peptidase n=1 Tax=Bacillus sp. JJ1122 TaxID=3122951 RepID=UPI003000EC8E
MKKLRYVLLVILLLSSLLPASLSLASGKSSSLVMTVVLSNNNDLHKVRADIEKSGAKVVKQMNEIGVLQVKGSADLLEKLQRVKGVQSIGPAIMMKYPVTKKVSLNQAILDKRVQEKMNPDQLEKLLQLSSSSGSSILSGTKQDSGIIKPDPEEPEETEPFLYETLQWDIKRVTNNGKSFETEKGNHNVVIGIIDTGVDVDHPDLKANLLGGRNFVPSYDGGILQSDQTETGDPLDINDRNGHGSHVAGSIAGKGLILGVAPEIGFKAYRVFGAEGGASTATVSEAIVGAADDQVDVISMSLGGYSVLGKTLWKDPSSGKIYNLGNEVADFQMYKRAVKYAVSKGVTIVAAAGNDGLDITNRKEVTEFLNQEYGPDGYVFIGAGVETPGTIPGVITVSATGPQDQIASYSNYGEGTIDVTAPGGDYGRYPKGDWYLDMNLSSDNQGGYIFMAGTSMATPKVSAVAGLLIAQNGKMSPSELSTMLKKRSEDIGKVSEDRFFGAGMVIAPNQSVEMPDFVEWQKNFGGVDQEKGSKMISTKDGGTLAIGSSMSYSTGGYPDYDIFVVKTGLDGRVEWRHVFGDYLLDWGNDIVETKNGYYVTGYKGTPAEGETQSKTDIFLAKINKDGSIAWEKMIGEQEKYEGANSLIATLDGNLIFAGNKEGEMGGENMAYVVKLDTNGHVLWDKTYDSQTSITSDRIIQTKDGCYIIAGDIMSNDPWRKEEFFLIKIDSLGNEIWRKSMGTEARDYLYDLIENESGEILVTGEHYTLEWKGWEIEESHRGYLAKFTHDGQLVWEKTIDNGGNNMLHEFIKTPDGHYSVVGSIQNEENYDIHVIKVDENGEILKQVSFGGIGYDRATSVAKSTNGGYYIFGDSSSYSAGNEYDDDFYLVKVKASLLE